MALSVSINGEVRLFDQLSSPCALAELVDAMELKADRVAVELNGQIAPRAGWAEVLVATADRLEIVHFVGGGGLNRQGSAAIKVECQ